MTIRNHVQLVGNLGKDPEIRTFDNGNKLAKVSLAVSNQYKNAQGQVVQDTQWLNLAAWGKTAELMEDLCQKGSQIMVSGKIDSGNYQTKEGERKYYTQVVVNEFYLMNRPTSK